MNSGYTNLSQNKIVLDVNSEAHGGSRRLNFLLHLEQYLYIPMKTARDLTNNQKDTLKKLLLKQKEWENQKKAIKTAKKKSTKVTKQA